MPLPVADVLLRSARGEEVLDPHTRITPENVREFLGGEDVVRAAQERLEKLGFQVTLAGPSHITIRGPQKRFEEVFQTKLALRRAPYFRGGKREEQVYYLARVAPKLPPELAELVVGVEFPGPITYHQSPTPPPLAYDHLEVPGDVARDMEALKAHARGITGAGIRLAMVDSGFMAPQHPYYNGRGYNILPLVPDPADPSPNVDGVGHGTGISACALAVAPGVTYTVYKVYGSSFAAAFARAATAAPAPNVITCSWGVAFSAALRLSINNAVAAGIVVCFSSGNGGPVGWPGSETAVISVGGAFLGNDDSLQASSYASSGANANNPGRQAPDLCGLVGMGPRGIYIALPTQPGSSLDTAFAGGSFPSGDTTGASDGWLVASGTSSASPMVAGTAALIMQSNPAMVGNPAGVRAALASSCLDVTSGASASGETAGPGADQATGAGLVQAYRAIRGTDVWMKDNPTNDIGLTPTHNRRPAWPPHAHWVSPDIKVLSTMLTSPATDFDPAAGENPVFNQDNFVYLRIRNRGLQAAGPITVRLFYADPATSLVFPSDWKDGQSGVPAEGSLHVGGAATHSQNVPTVPANGDVVLPQPFIWQPPDPATALQTQMLSDGRIIGHFCLLTRIESVDDPIIAAGGGQSSVIDDNNIAMANQQVFSAPPGHMFLFNFYIRGATKKQGATRNELLLDLAALPRGATARLLLDTDTRKARLVNAKRERDAIVLSTGKGPAGIGDLALKSESRTHARVQIELPPRTKPHDYHISVAQLRGGHTLGGMDLVARLQPPFARGKSS